MNLLNDRVIKQRYRVLQSEIEGENGAGMPAWDLAFDQRVVIQPYANLTEADWEQFRQTAEALGQMVHASLPALRDWFAIDARSGALVWEWVEGESLEQRLLRSGGPQRPYRMLEWARQMAGAAAYLHTHLPSLAGLDIRPQGVTITPDGRAVLVDFNLSADPSLAATQPSRPADGDPAEAVTLPGAGARPDLDATQPPAGGSPATAGMKDVYDLGVLLFTGLAGAPPPELPARLQGTLLPDFRGLNPEVTPELEAVVLKAIHIAPEERYADAGALLKALAAAVQRRVVIRLAPQAEPQVLPLEQMEAGGGREPAPAGRRGGARRTRPAWTLPALVFLLLALLALAGMALAGGRPDEALAWAGSQAALEAESALALAPAQAAAPSPTQPAGGGSPTPLAAASTQPAADSAQPAADSSQPGAGPAQPTAEPTRPPQSPTPQPTADRLARPLTDWRENSFMPMFTGCPETDAICVRSDTNRRNAGSGEPYIAVMVLRDPLLIEPNWESPYLVFLYRVRRLNLENTSQSIQAESPPATIELRSGLFDVLEQVVLDDTGDEWQLAAVDLSAYRGQEISMQYVIGKFWGMLFLNDVRVMPDYRPEIDPTDLEGL